MKTLVKFGMAMMIALAFVGCRSSKPVEKKSPFADVQSMPCSDAAKSDKNFFREVGVSEDVEIETARLQALEAAKRLVRERLGGRVKGIAEDYVRNVSGQKAKKTQALLESRMLQAVDKVLDDANNPCEKVGKTEEGRWQVFYAIEVSKGVIAEKMAEEAAKDEELGLEFNRDNFAKRANELMKEME